MYFDKRFQLDQYFLIIPINQEQIKSSTSGGFLLAEQNSFNDITQRLLSIDKSTLSDFAARLSKGAPSWFITFAPADVQHPICLYYANTGETFKPDILPKDEQANLIANNPVASARFFDMMVKLSIKHVLGVNSDHDGLYGKTAAYYGTVEQQGRLTLHLHLLL
ncbi:hypothetical protein GLOTRDRAFT_105859 [Gloeophyllum trabeum ATCC 11539]|uniref:Helitron helicase-like domain-containing protein n=1 Tax=Gloeophyllum trabeum (strain ATCC 11539 / FP-39264 / Madison 617) TaxID=670483 RepID=S7Q9N0_GLOTA|nr:uncharacterized protein GLOTRDRAFT_105859 [Gloeophyllum trabeum ATCC 11539]EPQ56048.1 hypothetical protein GLOTRDRAFT_105859 [Gloeophyllum trabeum ATCC 11539]